MKGRTGTLGRMEVSGSSPTPTGPGGRSVTGILLVDPRRGPVADDERRRLASAVRDRGWMLTVRTAVATAFAELCLMDEEESSREAWGLPPRGDVVLVVARALDPATEADLRRAVEAYAPRTRCYRWTGVTLVPDDLDPEMPPDSPPGQSFRGPRPSNPRDDEAGNDPMSPPPSAYEDRRPSPVPTIDARSGIRPPVSRHAAHPYDQSTPTPNASGARR